MSNRTITPTGYTIPREADSANAAPVTAPTHPVLVAELRAGDVVVNRGKALKVKRVQWAGDDAGGDTPVTLGHDEVAIRYKGGTMSYAQEGDLIHRVSLRGQHRGFVGDDVNVSARNGYVHVEVRNASDGRSASAMLTRDQAEALATDLLAYALVARVESAP